MGDALEYFEDLGLEYNVDYVDASNTVGRRVRDNYDEEDLENEELENMNIPVPTMTLSLEQLLKRPEFTMEILEKFVEINYPEEIKEQVSINLKYEGYFGVDMMIYADEEGYYHIKGKGYNSNYSLLANDKERLIKIRKSQIAFRDLEASKKIVDRILMLCEGNDKNDL